MRLAIIGSGISGLAAARELAPEHRVTVFEAGRNLGGHTNTIDLDLCGETLAVDTGFIVFNDRTYPGFSKMLRDLNVASMPSAMSFSVQHEATGIEYNGHSLGRLFAQRRNLLRPGFYRMIRGILRLSREAKAWLAERDAPRDAPTAARAVNDAGLTLGDFLARGRYPAEVVDWYIVPMASAIWSAPGAATLRLPFEFFCRFFDNHGFFDMGERPTWRTVAGGSREYVRAIAAEIQSHGAVIRTRCPVRWVRRSPGTHRYQQHIPAADGGVEVVSTAGTERFDAVLIATHSDTALSLLADPVPAEMDILSAMPYQENQAIVHTDARLMPRTRRAWAAWNAHVLRDAEAGGAGGRAMITYNMNILQGLAPRDGSQVLVTLNNHAAIDPARTLRLIGYHHPVYTTAGFAAQKRFEEISGPNRTFYAGAYWRYGFHEDGHWSGLRAAAQVRRLALHQQERRA